MHKIKIEKDTDRRSSKIIEKLEKIITGKYSRKTVPN